MGFVKKKDADNAYAEEKPIMTDQEYDKRYGANANSSTIPLNSPWEKAKHERPMASLDKVPTFDDEGNQDFTALRVWYSKAGTPLLTGSWKYDGISIRLTYNHGNLVRAVTKGDEEYGEDITRNVLKMQNVRPKLDRPMTGDLSAEIVMTQDDYDSYIGETMDRNPYANKRNGACGAAKALDGRNCKYLTLMYYGIYDGIERNEKKVFDDLNAFGFLYVEYSVIHTFEELVYQYGKALDMRAEINFDVDGLVLCVDGATHQVELGHDNQKRPRFKVCVKFPYQEAETTLNEIEWSMEGTHGTMTPMAVIEPVDLGVTVKRPTLHNLNSMEKMKIIPGDRVIVSRRGDVIPHVERSLTAEEEERTLYDVMDLVPTECPICSGPTKREGAFLRCSGIDCPSKGYGDLLKLYNLTDRDVMHACSVSVHTARKILAFQVFKEIPLDVFMGALNVQEIGSTVWNYAIKAHKCETFQDLYKLSQIDLEKLDGIGDTLAERMWTGLRLKLPTVETLASLGTTGRTEHRGEQKLTGLKFCITGSLREPRSHYEGLIREHGGEPKGFGKSLDYLIVGQKPGSKLKKATAANVQVITEDEFLAML